MSKSINFDDTKQDNQETEKIFSISEYIDILNDGFKNYNAKIVGEVSDVNFGPTGHVYFKLKDDKDQSTLKCVIFKPKYDLYNVKIEVGTKLMAFGCPNLHKQFGFSFIAETIEYAGEGILKKEYDKLKKKLTEEGLFEVARKRPLPEYPQRIGVITALKGAVIADFSNNLERFGFKVTMIDSRVEGQIAVDDLLSAIKTLKKRNIEVLVIMRGGGSLESLIAFNNEKLVREVVSFPVPVIAAIGHHKDMPLVAMAADIEVSTPTAAAVTLNSSWIKAITLLDKYQTNIFNNYQNVLRDTRDLISKALEGVRKYANSVFNKYKKIENDLKVSFQNFKNALLNVKSELNNLLNKSLSEFRMLLSGANQQLEHAEQIISSNNPERQLSLGYSIARYKGKIIRKVKDVAMGENIDLNVTDGVITSEVKNINKN